MQDTPGLPPSNPELLQIWTILSEGLKRLLLAPGLPFASCSGARTCSLLVLLLSVPDMPPQGCGPEG